MNRELLQMIEKKYQLKVKDYKSMKKAWILETDQGPYFFKSFVFKDGPRLQFIDGAMRHLINQGFDYIIPFVQTKDELPYFTHQAEVYFLAPFLDVRQSNYDNPTELTQATRLLAGMHLASHSYKPDPRLNPQYFWGLWPRRLKEKIQHLYTFRSSLQNKRQWDEFDHLFAERFTYFFQQAHQAYYQLLRSDYTRLMYNEQRFHTFCHHDYEYHNVLINPKDHYYIIDFDYLLCDTHLHDLTSLIIRAGKRDKWKEERRDRVLQTYHEIYPLQPEEIPVIKAVLLFPQAYWQIGFARYFEQQPWPIERFVSELKRKTKNEKQRLRYIENLEYPQ